MRTRVLFLLLPFAIGLMSVPALAQTNISGAITTSTWTATNSPYYVVSQCTVATGNTLTIEPGVDMLFDADVLFVVEGALDAVGTETDSIRFIANVAAGNAEWMGLRLSGDSSTIYYTRISDAYNGQVMRTLANGRVGPGEHTITWDGRDDNGRAAASGVYLYRIVLHHETGGRRDTAFRRMVLVK